MAGAPTPTASTGSAGDKSDREVSGSAPSAAASNSSLGPSEGLPLSVLGCGDSREREGWLWAGSSPSWRADSCGWFGARSQLRAPVPQSLPPRGDGAGVRLV